MKEINGIDLAHMKSGAHFLFITDTVGLATADAKVKTKVTAELTALQTALKAEDDALALSKANLLSKEIKAIDAERDKHYKALRKAIKFFLSHPDAEQVKAAQRLERLLKDYNIDPKMQLDRETGLLLNLISDLETKSAADVTALALTPVVQAMKQANDKLREVTRARANDRAVQIVGQLKQAQHASDEAYRTLVQKVNALAVGTVAEGLQHRSQDAAGPRDGPVAQPHQRFRNEIGCRCHSPGFDARGAGHEAGQR